MTTVIEQEQLVTFDKDSDEGYGRGPMQSKLITYRAEIARNTIMRTVGGSGIVLDMGCGPGNVANRLSDLSKVVGLDIAITPLVRAKDVTKGCDGNVEYLLSRVQTVPFGDNVFSTVLAFEIFEHLTEVDGNQMLREAKRVLEPGGALVLSTPNANSLAKRTARKLGLKYQRHDHANEVGIEDMVELVGKSGLTVEEYWGVGLIPGLWTIQQIVGIPLFDDWNTREAGRMFPSIASSTYLVARKY